jgi:hypothetical protein
MILDGDNMMKFLYIEISSAIINAVGFLLVHLYEFRNINGIFFMLNDPGDRRVCKFMYLTCTL